MKNEFSREGRSTVEFRTANNELVRLHSNSGYFTNPSHSTIRLSPKMFDGTRPDATQYQDLHIAYAGNYDDIIARFIDARITQRLASQDGEIFVAQSRRSDLQGLLLWRGPHHEIASWLPSVAEGVGIDPFQRFKELRFQDHADGLVVRCTNPNVKISVVDVSNHVDGVGALSLHSAGQALDWVPVKAGRSVPAGEVWRRQIQRSPQSEAYHILTLATPTLVANLDPDFEASVTLQQQLNFLESLTSVELAKA